MRVLWLCNIMLPAVAESLGLEASNKEGWLSGLSDVIMERQGESNIELAVACPMPESMFANSKEIIKGAVTVHGAKLYYYGFREDTTNPDKYDEDLEPQMLQIIKDYNPDVIHCYGTEYPHTLAMCRAYEHRERILISIQGLCSVCANTYFADLPRKVINSVTLRDFLKKDSIKQQHKKFVARGRMEIEAVKLAGNVTGRTAWDKHYTKEWNPDTHYYAMNETLRSNFYEGEWNEENVEAHSIFLSQGDYPIKGLHYMLLALPGILKEYPDAKVYVAGNSIVAYDTWKQKLKISAYGKYLRKLINTYKLQDKVFFLGRLDADEMKKTYLKSSLFVCCSTIENSPNSLGEAMLLGMPCVTAGVGGINSIFRSMEDGIVYQGYKSPLNSFDNACNLKNNTKETLDNNVKALTNAVCEIWDKNEDRINFCQNARNHAKNTHNRDQNYQRMTEIYSNIVEGIVEQ